MWIYQDKELTEIPEGYVGFTYLITNLLTGRMYVGKKNFYSTTRKKIKGKTNRKRIVAESSWKDYTGSSDTLNADIAEFGLSNFKRVILRLCTTKAEMSYFEIKEQLERDVLLNPNEYYNNFVGCKIHGNHMKPLMKKNQKSN